MGEISGVWEAKEERDESENGGDGRGRKEAK